MSDKAVNSLEQRFKDVAGMYTRPDPDPGRFAEAKVFFMLGAAAILWTIDEYEHDPNMSEFELADLLRGFTDEVDLVIEQ